MKWIFSVFFAVTCFAQTQYCLYPKGTFRSVSTNYGPYELSNFTLESYTIYTTSGGKRVLSGAVEKLNEWTRAYVYKIGDRILSTHRASLFSAGSLLDCLKQYEVLDENNHLIGTVEGNYYTNAAAEFSFFNEQRELLARARLNSTKQLEIRSPNETLLVTCTKTLKSDGAWSPAYEYFWTIQQEDNASFDPRFLWPFLGFIGEVWWYSSAYAAFTTLNH